MSYNQLKIYIGQKISKDVYETNWKNIKEQPNLLYCIYQGYTFTKKRIQDKYEFQIEFPSNHRGDWGGVLLNVIITTNTSYVTTEIWANALRCSCSDFPYEIPFVRGEHKQITRVLNRIFGIREPVFEREYTGMNLSQGLINSIWLESSDNIKRTTYQGYQCKIDLIDNENQTQELLIFLPSPTRKSISLIVGFVTDFDFVIKSLYFQSVKNNRDGMDFEINDEEKSTIRDVVAIMISK